MILGKIGPWAKAGSLSTRRYDTTGLYAAAVRYGSWDIFGPDSRDNLAIASGKELDDVKACAAADTALRERGLI
jgi:hypothetical protein